MRMKTQTLVLLGLMAAMSVALVYLIHFPIFGVLPDLEYDPADILIVLGGMLFGPVPGLMLTFVVCALQALTVSAKGGIAGFIMHFVATGTMVTVLSLVYKRFPSIKGAIAALLLGATAMTAIMIPLNLIVTPLFYSVPVQAIKSLLLPAIIPFNVIKAYGNCTAAFLLYMILRTRAGDFLRSFQE